jgi:hypothetical protein
MIWPLIIQHNKAVFNLVYADLANYFIWFNSQQTQIDFSTSVAKETLQGWREEKVAPSTSTTSVARICSDLHRNGYTTICEISCVPRACLHVNCGMNISDGFPGHDLNSICNCHEPIYVVGGWMDIWCSSVVLLLGDLMAIGLSSSVMGFGEMYVHIIH